MILLIRISGLVNRNKRVEKTLHNLRLRKKYTAVIVKENPEIGGMIKKVRNFIAYGNIEEKIFVELIKARGKLIGKKGNIKDAEKVAKEVFSGKTLEELGVKPFFGLHPARGGIDTKHHYPKGVLGKHEDISKLLMKML